MKREELEVKDFLEHPLNEAKAHYYRKSDADKVMDALEARIKELEDKVQMHDFFWEVCSLSKRGFKNTIDVANYIKEIEEKLAMKLDPALYPNCNDCECCKHPATTEKRGIDGRRQVR